MLASGLLLVALLACLTVMVLMSVWQQRKSRGKLPPGPTPLPFIGNYLQLNTEQMYTSIMKVSQGREMVTFSTWESAKSPRRFSMATLRDFGVGKTGFLIEALRGTRCSNMDPAFFLSRTVSNVISSIVFGDCFDYEDKEFLSLLRMMLGSFQFTATSTGQRYEMFSLVMKHLPGPQQQGFKELQGLEDFIAKKVEHKQHTLDPNSPRDFIDSFLICIQEEEQNPDTEFTNKNMLMTVIYLLFAGTMTVSATVGYTLLLLMKYPHVQKRVREELTQELGSGRAPSLGDRTRLPYTDAVLHEAQRLLALVPMGIPRTLMRTTRFRGYTLPQGTEVFPLLGSILHDPSIFKHPEEFNPDRFLDADGRFRKHEAFLPFSLGKRVCLGEGLAKAELFLFFTTILQAFSLESPCPLDSLSLKPTISGLFNIPPAFQLQVRPTDLHSTTQTT
ncbi:cytochrome P450 2S1 isoform X3 [Macaca mulatta]